MLTSITHSKSRTKAISKIPILVVKALNRKVGVGKIDDIKVGSKSSCQKVGIGKVNDTKVDGKAPHQMVAYAIDDAKVDGEAPN